MDLGRIARDSEDRDVVRGAIATAAVGAVALLRAGIAWSEGAPVAGAVVAAILFFALAYGVYRGSRAAAIAALVLWGVTLLVTALGGGWIVSLPNLVITAVLIAGLRGVLAQRARPSADLG